MARCLSNKPHVSTVIDSMDPADAVEIVIDFRRRPVNLGYPAENFHLGGSAFPEGAAKEGLDSNYHSRDCDVVRQYATDALAISAKWLDPFLDFVVRLIAAMTKGYYVLISNGKFHCVC